LEPLSVIILILFGASYLVIKSRQEIKTLGWDFTISRKEHYIPIINFTCIIQLVCVKCKKF
jgi:hypothetical protein